MGTCTFKNNFVLTFKRVQHKLIINTSLRIFSNSFTISPTKHNADDIRKLGCHVKGT